MPSQSKTNTAANTLVQEYAIAITINELNYAVMMASPYDLDDFAIGLLIAEQIIQFRYDVHDITITYDHPAHTAVVNVILANRISKIFKHNRRQNTANSSCGVCGIKALADAFPNVEPLVPTTPFTSQQILSLQPKLVLWQNRNQQTGALHAAFLINEYAEVIASREDIGRHNAVDKLIGYVVSEQLVAAQLAILVTSRCSVELVHKAIVAKVGSLLSLAAPTQLAVKVAKENNLNLIHVRKHDGPLFY